MSADTVNVSSTMWRTTSHSSRETSEEGTVRAAVDLDRSAGQVARVFGTQERADPAEVAGIADEAGGDTRREAVARPAAEAVRS